MFLYPAEPFAGRVPDEAYVQEQAQAEQMQLTSALLDIEALLEGNLSRSLRWVQPSEELCPAVYRGWMLRPDVYDALYQGLSAKNWQLINSPAQYLHTHHLPESFAAIADSSPRTVWLPARNTGEVDWEAVQTALVSFGSAPLIVKDYVKSRKHEWDEACFIPDAADTAHALRVIQTFLTRQGSEFQGGLVLRAFENFAPLAEHSRSGMPLTREYRLFFLGGHIIGASPYWEEGEYPVEPLPLAFLRGYREARPEPFLHGGRGATHRRGMAHHGTRRRAGGGPPGATGHSGVVCTIVIESLGFGLSARSILLFWRLSNYE